jgi:hypothetical protein
MKWFISMRGKMSGAGVQYKEGLKRAKFRLHKTRPAV